MISAAEAQLVGCPLPAAVVERTLVDPQARRLVLQNVQRRLFWCCHSHESTPFGMKRNCCSAKLFLRVRPFPVSDLRLIDAVFVGISECSRI